MKAMKNMTENEISKIVVDSAIDQIYFSGII